MKYHQFIKLFDLEQKTILKEKRFRNEHNEEFVVIKFGPVVYIVGDETDWEVIYLFNEKFNIYNRVEYKEIGKILQEFAK